MTEEPDADTPRSDAGTHAAGDTTAGGTKAPVDPFTGNPGDNGELLSDGADTAVPGPGQELSQGEG